MGIRNKMFTSTRLSSWKLLTCTSLFTVAGISMTIKAWRRKDLLDLHFQVKNQTLGKSGNELKQELSRNNAGELLVDFLFHVFSGYLKSISPAMALPTMSKLANAPQVNLMKADLQPHHESLR